jgi:D-allose-binding periplasmic protein
MKKILTSILSILALFLMISCGAKEEGKEVATGDKAEVAIILKTLSNPFWVSMKEGIEKEAEKQGVKVDIFAANSEEDVQEQLKLLENLLGKDYKAIGVAPLSPVNLIPGIVEANKKGIYVVNIDEKIDMDQLKTSGGSVLAFVTTDNIKVGAKGAKFIVDKLVDGGEVAIIEGKAGNASGEFRKQGATEVFKSNDKIKLVASQPADWDRSKALDLAANLIQKYPNLKAIYAANDTMALGALQAVMNANKQDKIIVVGTDGAPEALDSIKQKGLSATVAQDSANIGAESLKLLLEALKNKPEINPNNIPQEIPVESNLITQ